MLLVHPGLSYGFLRALRLFWSCPRNMTGTLARITCLKLPFVMVDCGYLVNSQDHKLSFELLVKVIDRQLNKCNDF